MTTYGTYNNRALSTVVNESMFATADSFVKQHADLKAVDCPTVMAKAVYVEQIKYKPGKAFAVQTSNRRCYPVEGSDRTDLPADEDGEKKEKTFELFQNHKFDVPSARKPRQRQDGQSKPDAPQRGIDPLRRKGPHMRYNEQRIAPEHLHNMQREMVEALLHAEDD